MAVDMGTCIVGNGRGVTRGQLYISNLGTLTARVLATDTDPRAVLLPTTPDCSGLLSSFACSSAPVPRAPVLPPAAPPSLQLPCRFVPFGCSQSVFVGVRLPSEATCTGTALLWQQPI